MMNAVEVRDLTVVFKGGIRAVDGVSFGIGRDEVLGVVGESGSGKSTAARVIAGLLRPTAGEVAVDGRIGMVFQDPLGSLNPRRTVREVLGARARELIDEVALPESALDKFPHEFSGGERQRICIARALAQDPRILICDEAVSALDLSIRARVLELLSELRKRRALAMMFITHDLGVVQHIADRLIVMKSGRIVERGTVDRVLKSPEAAYTRELIAAVPRIGGDFGVQQGGDL